MEKLEKGLSVKISEKTFGPTSLYARFNGCKGKTTGQLGKSGETHGVDVQNPYGGLYLRPEQFTAIDD